MQKLCLALLGLFLFVGCGSGSYTIATGRWQSPTTSGTYIWLRLNDNSGSVSGTWGTSSTSGGIAISGTRNGSYLDISSITSSGSVYFEGSISGDAWTADTVVCTSSCSSGTIRFNRTSYSATASLEIQGSAQFETQFKLLLSGLEK